MHRPTPGLPFVVVLLLATGVLLAAGVSAPSPEVAETLRIERHLERVAESLRAHRPDHLTAEQRAARIRVVGWLDEYREAGVFPHNHVHPEGRAPVFVDPHGTPCAVGYLMVRSGADDLVEEIVRTDNLVRVAELAGDGRVAAWLEDHGLTLAEAARIQPAYDPRPPIPRVQAAYAEQLTVGLSIVTAALTSYMAAVEPQRGAPWLDALAVGTSVGHTAILVNAATNDFDDPGWMNGLNVLGALASAGSVVVRAVRRGHVDAAGPESAVRAFVSPGQYGTQIGLTVRP